MSPASGAEHTPRSWDEAKKQLDRFEEAWQSGATPRLDDFLLAGRPDSAGARRLLEELVKVDLEYRWRQCADRSAGPRLEDYSAHHEALGRAEHLPLELIGWEYFVRQRWGDRPRADDYVTRFPNHGTKLRPLLAEMDARLAAECARERGPARLAPRPPELSPATPAKRMDQTPSAATLLAALRDHQLLDASQLADLSRVVPSRFSEPRLLGRELLQRGWLTAYQVNQLLQGQGADLVRGPYLLLERLGEGGAGQVFKARHQKMKRVVALKVIRRELLADAEAVARFYREIQVVSQLDHANVVHAFDAGPVGQTHFLAMEFVEGTDLGRLVKQGGPLPVQQACEYIRQAALGLQHAHERGLVHRDIKPHNLIMSVREGLIKVADLGLARLPRAVNDEASAVLGGARSTGTLTPENAVMIGTADYLAPEQAIDFHGADSRADLYSLGCTFYFLLAGQPPFAGGMILKDGRVMFSSLESQGSRSGQVWGIWNINPDGSNWGPMLSAFDKGVGANDAFHFQTQLSDGTIVVEKYYNQNNSGFGTLLKFPVQPPAGVPGFGPGYLMDPRNPFLRMGSQYGRLPFSPYGLEVVTRFANDSDWVADPSVPGKMDSPRLGKLTHPSAAPDNHLLTVWSPGGVGGHGSERGGRLDSGIYMIKRGEAVDEPGQMLLIKSDPNYNEQWPRALVPYKRIYGMTEPQRLAPVANDGKQSTYLPEGTPFGLTGTSSLYKRDTYPLGVVPKGKVTAQYAGGKDPYRGLGPNKEEGVFNWFVQGSDAGLYSNSDIWGIRIVVEEPTTRVGRRWYNHINERLRILGEFPVRKFNGTLQPTDPDGNPDTSFLTKIPADVSWTFQTIDNNGLVLNMAQTWHQVRPGEVRHDCGGCHAHSQKPTHFKDTAAARSDYVPWDLTGDKTPLFTAKKQDESGKKWDVKDETGVRFVKGIKKVEYYRDVRPILNRSCVACHSQKNGQPASNLALDDDALIQQPYGDYPGNSSHVMPTTYFRLCANELNDAKKTIPFSGLRRIPEAHGVSPYIWRMQARRSLLIWKVFGRRLDGFRNEDVPVEYPGSPPVMKLKNEVIPDAGHNHRGVTRAYVGSVMPPPEAVEGTYTNAEGKQIKVAPLSDEDRLTLVRWVDLGCPIDLDFDPAQPQKRGFGFMVDDNRPTLALTYPQPGANEELSRILIGMHDYDSGLDQKTFQVVADFRIDGLAPGTNLASKFKALPDHRWEWTLTKPITELVKGKLTVSIKDVQGNVTRIERTFSVGNSMRANR